MSSTGDRVSAGLLKEDEASAAEATYHATVDVPLIQAIENFPLRGGKHDG